MGVGTRVYDYAFRPTDGILYGVDELSFVV
jgi:hypothetical protein